MFIEINYLFVCEKCPIMSNVRTTYYEARIFQPNVWTFEIPKSCFEYMLSLFSSLFAMPTCNMENPSSEKVYSCKIDINSKYFSQKVDH